MRDLIAKTEREKDSTERSLSTYAGYKCSVHSAGPWRTCPVHSHLLGIRKFHSKCIISLSKFCLVNKEPFLNDLCFSPPKTRLAQSTEDTLNERFKGLTNNSLYRILKISLYICSKF